MDEYILNAGTGTIHRADGCPDAQRHGNGRDWCSAGIYVGWKYAVIEAEPFNGGRRPRICRNCSRQR